jgi:hypothetical protein
MKPFSVWYSNGKKEKTRLGLQKELNITNERMLVLHSFLYAFQDYMEKQTPRRFKEMVKRFNDIYPICKDDDCPCAWKEEAWKVLGYPDKL